MRVGWQAAERCQLGDHAFQLRARAYEWQLLPPMCCDSVGCGLAVLASSARLGDGIGALPAGTPSAGRLATNALPPPAPRLQLRPYQRRSLAHMLEEEQAEGGSSRHLWVKLNLPEHPGAPCLQPCSAH